MTAATTVNPPASVCLDTAGVAQKLRRSPQTIRLFVKEQGLPAARINGRLIFDEAEVDAWLDARAEGAPATSGDDHRAAIKRLVDAAPPLTADQAAKIRAVLSGSAA